MTETQKKRVAGVLASYGHNLYIKKTRLSSAAQASEDRLNLCIDHVITFLENRINDLDSAAFPTEGFYVLWQPGDWLFLYKKEILEYFETGKWFSTTIGPPRDKKDLLSKIVERFNSLHTHVQAEHADGGHTDAIVFRADIGGRGSTHRPF